MGTGIDFPRVPARDLEGRDVSLPEGFSGQRNVVIVAFQRKHQRLVDSWIPWLEEQADVDPGLRFYELPTLARMWAPARTMIDGGMAAAIRDPVVLQRTLTIYGDVGRLTRPLAIESRSTISLFAVDGSGRVHWSGTGGFDAAAARALAAALRSI